MAQPILGRKKLRGEIFNNKVNLDDFEKLGMECKKKRTLSWSLSKRLLGLIPFSII